MKKISGFVLVKETGSGIPNLVVTAYDSETPFEDLVLRSAGIRKNISLKDIGSRIGSVLTDTRGRFELTTVDLEFAGNETRPDLLLAIFAPEDIQDPDKPYPRLPEERLLYLSRVSRFDAGAEEAFMIRLLAKQLERFDIGMPGLGGGLADGINNTWNARDAMKALAAPRLKKENAAAARIKSLARKNVRELSGIPLHLRNNELRNASLMINGRDELSKKLPKIQDQLVVDGIKRMRKTNPKLRLRLTADDFTTLGLKMRGDRVVGTVDPKELSKKLKSLSELKDLTKVRGLNNPSPDELEKRYLG